MVKTKRKQLHFDGMSTEDILVISTHFSGFMSVPIKDLSAIKTVLDVSASGVARGPSVSDPESVRVSNDDFIRISFEVIQSPAACDVRIVAAPRSIHTNRHSITYEFACQHFSGSQPVVDLV